MGNLQMMYRGESWSISVNLQRGSHKKQADFSLSSWRNKLAKEKIPRETDISESLGPTVRFFPLFSYSEFTSQKGPLSYTELSLIFSMPLSQIWWTAWRKFLAWKTRKVTCKQMNKWKGSLQTRENAGKRL